MPQKSTKTAALRIGASVIIYPVAGRRIRDPLTMRVITEAGLTVTMTGHWQRAIERGDLTLTAPKPVEQSTKKPPAKATTGGDK